MREESSHHVITKCNFLIQAKGGNPYSHTSVSHLNGCSRPVKILSDLLHWHDDGTQGPLEDRRREKERTGCSSRPIRERWVERKRIYHQGKVDSQGIRIRSVRNRSEVLTRRCSGRGQAARELQFGVIQTVIKVCA